MKAAAAVACIAMLFGLVLLQAGCAEREAMVDRAAEVEAVRQRYADWVSAEERRDLEALRTATGRGSSVPNHTTDCTSDSFRLAACMALLRKAGKDRDERLCEYKYYYRNSARHVASSG